MNSKFHVALLRVKVLNSGKVRGSDKFVNRNIRFIRVQVISLIHNDGECMMLAANNEEHERLILINHNAGKVVGIAISVGKSTAVNQILLARLLDFSAFLSVPIAHVFPICSRNFST